MYLSRYQHWLPWQYSCFSYPTYETLPHHWKVSNGDRLKETIKQIGPVKLRPLLVGDFAYLLYVTVRKICFVCILLLSVKQTCQ